MSTSQHPVALSLERLVGGDARLLALVMMLPLIDGVFPALILAGALDTTLGAIQVGLLIFGGSATVAVILAEMTGTPREQSAIVLLVGIPLIVLAGIQAALAPAIGSVVDIVIFERFAALVIAAIAAKTASATIGEYLPSPAVIIGLGLVASLDPNGAAFVVMDDAALVGNAVLAATIGVAFALGVALGGPYLREYMDIDRFRFGSAVALGLLPLSILGMAFGQAPLAALVVAAIFALDVPVPFDGDSSEKESSAGSDDRDLAKAQDQVLGQGATSIRELGFLPDRGSEDAPIFGGWVASKPDEGVGLDDSKPESPPSDNATDTEGRAPWL